MKDVAQVLRESVETVYELSAGDRRTGSDAKRAVLRRGRRRRAGRVAVAACAAVAVVVSAPVATNALFRRGDAQVAGRDVPDVGAELVWEMGGPVASDGRSVWFGRGTKEDEPGVRNSVARMELPDGEVVEGPVAATFPHQIAIADSGLWSVSWEGDLPASGEQGSVRGVIELLDPETLERTAVIEREGSAPEDVAVGRKVGREVVWVVDAARSTLLEIDPVDAEVAAEHAFPSRPSFVETHGRFVYVGSSEGHVVERIDPVTGETLHFEVPACANDAEVAAGSLWVADFCGDAVHRIDERSGEILASVSIGEPTTLEFAEGLMWVGANARVVRIDPVAGEVVGSPVFGRDMFAESMVYAGGSMWVGASGGVYRLDEEVPTATPSPAPDPVEAALPEGVVRVPVRGTPHALAADAESLWTGETTIDRLDPATGEVLAQVDAGGFVEDLELDESAGVLWALVQPAGDGDRIVLAVDARTDEIVLGPLDVVTLPPPGEKIAAHGGIAWVAGPGGTVNRVDLEEQEVVQIQLGRVGLDDTNVHVVAAANAALLIGTNGVVVRVDAESGEPARVDHLGAHIAAVTSREGRVWVAQQTRKGELFLWPLDAYTGEASHGRLRDVARGFPYLAEHEGTLWLAQAGGPDGRTIVSAFPAGGGHVVVTELPAGSTPTDVAAGPDGAWLTTGRGFLYRIDPR
jgi:streptogramin lyase